MANTKKNGNTVANKAPSEAVKPAEVKAEENKPAEKTYSEAEVTSLIEKAVAAALAKQSGEKSYVIAPEEKVTLLFLGGIAGGTAVTLPNIGKITKDGGTLTVPKGLFLQNITGGTESLLDERKLIVIDGLDEEERERFGVDYAEGETLTAKQFARLLTFDTETLCGIFEKLCEHQKRLVCRVLFTAYTSGDNRVTLEKVKAINDLSKAVDERGLLTRVVTEMASKLA